MIYTVRFAHLSEAPTFRVGAVLRRGDRIGTMGATGKCTGAHVHADAVQGAQTGRYNLADINAGRRVAAPVELFKFMTDRLFGTPAAVTTSYLDSAYRAIFDKDHPGVDIVPDNRKMTHANWGLKWPLDAPGRVMDIYDNDPGYGHCVLIAYEVA
jgi:hypothetical protein